MFTVTVRDHIMIAHSLHGAVFGPSQRLHGATYVVELAVRGPELTSDGILVDIARAGARLRAVLDELDRRNLDELPALSGVTTSTEMLARYIADRVAADAAAGGLGAAGPLASLTVTLHESPVAAASYERPL